MITKFLRKEGYAMLSANNGLGKMGLVGEIVHSDKRVHDITLSDDDPNARVEGTYKDNFLPEQEMVITTMFLDDTYWPAEDRGFLNEIVEELKLVYPKGHKKENEVIQPKDVEPTNYFDHFFTQFKTNVDNRLPMDSGDLVFDCSNPVHRLIYANWLFNPDAHVPGMEDFKYTKQDPNFKITLPEETRKERKDKDNLKIQAISLLSDKGINAETMKLIVDVMKVNVEGDRNDTDDLRTALLNGPADSASTLADFNLKTQQDVFLQLCNMPKKQLIQYATIQKAIKYQFIIRAGEVFRLAHNNEQLEGRYFQEVVSNLAKKKNADVYTKLADEVKTTEAQLYVD